MKGRTIIKKDGTVITEVLDRQGGDCKEVYKITERLGTQTGEEITGPDCDTVHETTHFDGQ
jgi:hypothetical protein